MNVRDVKEAVRLGQVVKAATYHAGARGLGFLQILAALEACHHVEEDTREGPAGKRLHPRGWSAFARLPNRRTLRIDFDLFEDESGRLLLVITAYEV